MCVNGAKTDFAQSPPWEFSNVEWYVEDYTIVWVKESDLKWAKGESIFVVTTPIYGDYGDHVTYGFRVNYIAHVHYGVIVPWIEL